MARLRTETVVWREVDGEIVALDVSTSTYLAVNPTGAFLWPNLVEGASQEELVERLVQGYDVNPEQAALDVKIFLLPLRERGLLEE